jgi:hypothetical protein
VKTTYQITDKDNTGDLAAYFAHNGEVLMPLVKLVEGSRIVVDELIDVMGRASIEAVLNLSAQKVAGPRHQGRKGGEIGWHGTQDGVVMLSDRKLRVKKPRLRRRGEGQGAEVPIPAYEALNDNELTGRRVLEILLRGVLTLPRRLRCFLVDHSIARADALLGARRRLLRQRGRPHPGLGQAGSREAPSILRPFLVLPREALSHRRRARGISLDEKTGDVRIGDERIRVRNGARAPRELAW